MRTEAMNVSGMQCGGCSTKLSLALNAINGVEDVQVSLVSGKITVRYDEQRTSLHDLEAAVINIGYGVRGATATNGHDPRPHACGCSDY
jgi:copper chaperone CopZ